MFVFTKGNLTKHHLIEDIPNLSAGQIKTNSSRRKKDGKFKDETRKPAKEMSRRTNIWRYAVGVDVKRDARLKQHPATFPEQLAQDHILSWSDEGDIVLDPMCGSGTTCKSAWVNNRSFIGIDMSEEYINDICKPRLTTYGWTNEIKDLAVSNI